MKFGISKKTSQYNTEEHKGGLFTYYVNTFLKVKQESSGWPSDCVPTSDQSEESSEIKESHRTYVESYFENKKVYVSIPIISKSIRA